MKKSVYSLVLSDRVVSHIDAVAYEKGMSRSALINQVLADYASLTTPEQRMSEILDCLSAHVDGHDRFQVMFTPSGSMVSFKSAIEYKYNPAIRYSVELGFKGDGEVGELRVWLRSQSGGLVDLFDLFFTLWARAEEGTLKSAPRYTASAGRYARTLRAEHAATSDELGQSIAAYIKTLDLAFKDFLKNYEELPRARARIGLIYQDGIKRRPVRL